MTERNADRNAAIYARRCSGLTLKEIAGEFRLTKETVRVIAKRLERQARWYAAQRREFPSIPIPLVFEDVLNGAGQITRVSRLRQSNGLCHEDQHATSDGLPLRILQSAGVDTREKG
jgi:predicted transcriptional regulator